MGSIETRVYHGKWYYWKIGLNYKHFTCYFKHLCQRPFSLLWLIQTFCILYKKIKLWRKSNSVHRPRSVSRCTWSKCRVPVFDSEVSFHIPLFFTCRVLQARTGTRGTSTFPCLFHNNLSFMKQTRKSAAASWACFSLSYTKVFYLGAYFSCPDSHPITEYICSNVIHWLAGTKRRLLTPERYSNYMVICKMTT